MPQDSFVVGLDIGTTKVCAIIGEKNRDGEIEIIGVGDQPSTGLHRGMVVNVADTVKSIKKAIEEAQLMAGVEVHSVYVGIAGKHIKSINSPGVIAISNETREINIKDVDRVIEAATSISLSGEKEREIIHVIPQEFYVDGQDSIQDPVGMSGVRLEADVHLVTADVSATQNIVKSVHQAGYDVEDIVLDPLASSYAVLDNDEKELGVCLVDIGGGTRDISLFHSGSVYDSKVIALGGEHVTQDVMKGLRTSSQDAEKVKIDHGCAIIDMVPEDETIEVPSVGGREPRTIPRRHLCEIIQPRMEEIFKFIDYEIKQSDYRDEIIAGMVVTGGASGMRGVPELAEQIVDMPVRLGKPWGISGLIEAVSNPKYATGVGLVQYGFEQLEGEHQYSNLSSGGHITDIIRKRMKSWFDDMKSLLSG